MTLPSAALWTLLQALNLVASRRDVAFGQRSLPAFLPTGEPTGVVLLLEDDLGAGFATAAALRRGGAAVVVVDAGWYLADAARGRRKCTLADVDFEALAKVSEKALGLSSYRRAELVGVGPRGAALAYLALAQAPAGTFAGGVSVGFCPELTSPAPFCHGRGLEKLPSGETVSAEPRHLLPEPAVVEPWTVLGAGACGDGVVDRFAGRMSAARFTPAGAGEGSVARTVDLAAAPASSSSAAAGLADLPLREVEAAEPAKPADTPEARLAARAASDAFVVLLTGDGGWTGFDREVGSAMGRLGVPVVGVDSLRYFWIPRSPEEVGSDLSRVVSAYLAAWGKRRVILAGYSQGADVMPFMAAGLQPELRRKVALVALLGPDPKADFSVDLAGWGAGADAPVVPERPVLPELARLRGLPLLCVFGQREERSLCPQLDRRRATLLPLAATGHFYGDHAAEIVDSILEAANGEPLEAPRAPHPRGGHAIRNGHAG